MRMVININSLSAFGGGWGGQKISQLILRTLKKQGLEQKEPSKFHRCQQMDSVDYRQVETTRSFSLCKSIPLITFFNFLLLKV